MMHFLRALHERLSDSNRSKFVYATTSRTPLDDELESPCRAIRHERRKARRAARGMAANALVYRFLKACGSSVSPSYLALFDTGASA